MLWLCISLAFMLALNALIISIRFVSSILSILHSLLYLQSVIWLILQALDIMVIYLAFIILGFSSDEEK
jgi:hypothetical protein